MWTTSSQMFSRVDTWCNKSSIPAFELFDIQIHIFKYAIFHFFAFFHQCIYLVILSFCLQAVVGDLRFCYQVFSTVQLSCLLFFKCALLWYEKCWKICLQLSEHLLNVGLHKAFALSAPIVLKKSFLTDWAPQTSHCTPWFLPF